ncbi:Mu-like prophage FluMu protein GP27 [Rhodopseudomonas palustris TIE-1]|uniref:phage protein Gp27 family protein n=1 Tax=Rhodopseudomonas palustris TaxID=1076 RepID=UPI000164A9CC|nr:phage protein Gp27 family protein [Rhodopseudomonas palustris]ACF01889.1 Mu-like prophage FluMu protein GP27 [Rhodopseudomonas palustris TIE-1]
MKAARHKRGRLSEIDKLPEWADEAKLWAFEQLKERKLTQLEILDGFNGRLKVAAFEQGITDPPVISRSAFNRTAIRIAILSRRLEETREIAAVIAPKLDEAGDNSLTLMVAETLKTLISEMLGNAGELTADGATAEMLMMTARALAAAEQAKRISADGRRKIEAELNAKASKAVDQVAKAKGLTTETVDAIKAKILGIDTSKGAKP